MLYARINLQKTNYSLYKNFSILKNPPIEELQTIYKTYNNDKDCLYNIKTPYEKIHINNFEIIKEIFNDTMRDFSCIGLKFNHGNIEFDN